MASILRFFALTLLLVGAVGCGTGAETQIAPEVQACGIEGLSAPMDETVSLAFALPNQADPSRPRVKASYVKAKRTPIELAADFDPFSDKEIVALPADPGETELSVKFVLRTDLSEDEEEVMIATPGAVRLTIDYAAASANATCYVDVELVPAALP